MASLHYLCRILRLVVNFVLQILGSMAFGMIAGITTSVVLEDIIDQWLTILIHLFVTHLMLLLLLNQRRSIVIIEARIIRHININLLLLLGESRIRVTGSLTSS